MSGCPDPAELQVEAPVPKAVTLKTKSRAQKAQTPWDDSAAEQDTIPAFGGPNQAASIITAPDFGGVSLHIKVDSPSALLRSWDD